MTAIQSLFSPADTLNKPYFCSNLQTHSTASYSPLITIMAEFTSLATSYVLADDEAEQQRIAGQAAEAIQNSPRKSAAVLAWAQSINQWMPANGGDDADSDVIVRAKALGFLAATLEVLEKDVLRVEQVEHLLKFFGAMFTIDHKAGILAASTALRCLCSMQYFRPKNAASVFEYLTKLGEDFRLQVPPTRRAVYDLVGLLVRNDAVIKSLGQTNGSGAQFLVDLLQLCRSERDPDNLLRWFAILRRILERYDPPLDVTVAQDVFKAASDYFPISMRSSATPAGTTVDDLKAALRGVFSASSLAALSVFDFLLSKMDQGDALTVSVKVDILSTINACIDAFPQPVETVVPHTSRIWNSLKYEVRHGDVPETIEGTLHVVQAISTRLSTIEDATYIKDFVGVVLADCISDLANTTFARPAGQLLNSTMLGGYRAYNLAISSVIGTVKKDLQQAQVANQTRDLVGVLNSVLKTRQTLVSASSGEVDSAAVAEFHSHDISIADLLDSVFLRLWSNTLKETAGAEANPRQQGQDPVVLNEVIRGLAALIVQRGALPSPDAERPLLCSSSQCARIFETLAPRILASSGEVDASLSQTEVENIAHESMTALQVATFVYPDGFAYLVQRTVASITDLIPTPTLLSSPSSLAAIKDTLARVAYIGCSTIPTNAGSEGHALAHFRTLTQSLFSTLEQLLDAKASFQASNAVLSGIYGAALNLRDAFVQRGVVCSAADKAKKLPVSAEEEDEALVAQKKTLSQLFQAYLQEATSIVQRLYVRATAAASTEIELSADFDLSSSSASALDEQDQYLHQLAGFTTFVVRDLDEAQQKEAKLNEASFNLFNSSFSGKPSFFHNSQGGRVDILSLGILKGLWPAAIASLADLNVSPLNLLDDFESLERLPPRTRQVRNTIATVVANKYSAAASIGPSKAQYPDNAASWQQTVEAVKAKLETAGASTLTPNRFSRLVAIAAGAFARLDRDAKVLASLLVFAPATHAAQPAVTPAASQYAEKAGQQMARILGGLLVSDRTLSTDDHAVVKSIYKQWVYGQTVKALLPLAFPRKTVGDSSESTDASAAAARRASTVYTIAILALVRGMPFSVYEDDVSNKDASGVSLVRVLVAATTTLVPQWGDVAVALRVLSAILAANRGDAVRSHLKTVIDASIHVFGSPTALPASRKEAISLISQLPTHYEEGLLLPYEPRLARALATACGDRVREIRDVAQLARENWVKVAI